MVERVLLVLFSAFASDYKGTTLRRILEDRTKAACQK